MAKRRDALKQQILASGYELAVAILEAAGCTTFEDIGQHSRTFCPWRKDEHPSLDILKAADGSTPAGSFIDRATRQTGDVFTLAGNVWQLDPKTSFPTIVRRCADMLGLKAPEPKPPIPVEQRDPTEDDRAALAASYGLTLDDFRAAGCTFGPAWFPDLGQLPGRDAPGSEAPAIHYHAHGPDGKMIKNKTIFRYQGNGAEFVITPPPAGKRHSSGRGTGFFVVNMRAKTPLVYTGGEEKALAAARAGFRAVSYTHGEKPPKPEEARWLAEKASGEVIIAFDADKAGAAATAPTAATLAAAGYIKIRAVAWPKDTPDKHDLADILRDSGPEALAVFLNASRQLEGILPQVVVNDRQLRDIVDDAWRVLLADNDPPKLFHRGSRLVLRKTKRGRGGEIHEIAEAGLPELRAILCRSADWVKMDPKGRPSASRIPQDALEDMLCRPHPAIPCLEAILTSPAYGASGELLARPGYHASDFVWMQHTLPLPEIPPVPSRDAIYAARDMLLDIFCDFPLAGDADRAHLLAMVLLPFTRLLIDGPTPLHLVTSPTPGTGKSLLATVVALLATGQVCEARQLSDREEERQKMLFSELNRGASVILLDNVSQRRMLDSGTLASYLTTQVVSDRILGATRQETVSNLATWVLTGNNVALSNELARRSIQIRLDAQQDRPWQRTSFKHKDLTAHVSRHRPELVAAVLTLARGWIAAGRPPGDIHLGSFEEWARVIGGILKVAGVTATLANIEDLYERSDVEGSMWREFVEAWWSQYSSQLVKPSDLREFCIQRDLLSPVLGDGSERGQVTKLGNALRKIEDRVFNDLKIVRTKGRDGWMFSVKPKEDGARIGNSAEPCGTSVGKVPHPQPEFTQDFAEPQEPAEPFGGYARGGFIENGKKEGLSRIHTGQKVPQVPQAPHNTEKTDTYSAEPWGFEVPQGSAGSAGGFGEPPEVACPAGYVEEVID